jgi:hypothetical protein
LLPWFRASCFFVEVGPLTLKLVLIKEKFLVLTLTALISTDKLLLFVEEDLKKLRSKRKECSLRRNRRRLYALPSSLCRR